MSDKPIKPVCLKCGSSKQVWRNQISGLMTCHRVGCHIELSAEAPRSAVPPRQSPPTPAPADALPQSVPEIAGLERCEFDDECDCCENPTGGTFTRLVHNPEDVTEAEFYICRDCVFEAVTRYVRGAVPPQPAQPAELSRNSGQLPVAQLLLQSKRIHEHNFGPSAAADWIYSDLLELLETAPPQHQPLTLEQADAIQRMPDVRQCLVAYAQNPNVTLACYVVKAVAVGIGAKP